MSITDSERVELAFLELLSEADAKEPSRGLIHEIVSKLNFANCYYSPYAKEHLSDRRKEYGLEDR